MDLLRWCLHATFSNLLYDLGEPEGDRRDNAEQELRAELELLHHLLQFVQKVFKSLLRRRRHLRYQGRELRLVLYLDGFQ